MLPFRHTKQTNKNVADTAFKLTNPGTHLFFKKETDSVGLVPSRTFGTTQLPINGCTV